MKYYQRASKEESKLRYTFFATNRGYFYSLNLLGSQYRIFEYPYDELECYKQII